MWKFLSSFQAYVELPHLMAIQLPIIELKKCRNLLSHVADDMICAGRKTGNYDACTGDSGGPMVTKKGQVGIVAWGLGCGREGVPGVYTSVAYHKHWIAKRVQENTEWLLQSFNVPQNFFIIA